jgi:hypothetical protein
MPGMRHNVVILDPRDLDGSMHRLAGAYDLSPDMLSLLRRIVALFPRTVQLSVDEAGAILYEDLSLADKFTFDIESDSLLLYNTDPDTFIDALIEMALYLMGFSTMMGSADEWVTEFAIGAWKPVRNRIKRELDIPVHTQPRAVVGMPPPIEQAPVNDPYPFRTLVSTYDLASFYQMVILAARDDVAVYFPPETHHKVLAVYVYMRRAMQEVAKNIDITDHEAFNARLVTAVQRLQRLFDPSNLPPPSPIRGTSHQFADESSEYPKQLDLFADNTPKDSEHNVSPSPPAYDPFEAFIEELFGDDDPLRGDTDS